MKIRRERVSAAPAQACSPQRSSRVDPDSPAFGAQRQRNFNRGAFPEADFWPAWVNFRIARYIRAIAEYVPGSDIPTTSPWNGFVFPARERTSRTIRAEQRNAHDLARAIFDRGRALISVEIRLSEPRGH
jgi:hypothetical protein